jgi:hypothetical protein
MHAASLQVIITPHSAFLANEALANIASTIATHEHIVHAAAPLDVTLANIASTTVPTPVFFKILNPKTRHACCVSACRSS